MEALKKGDIVLSAAQTEALIRTGKASGHGHAYALGTLLSGAYAGSSIWGGDSGTWHYNNNWTNTNKYATSSSSGSSGGGSRSSGSSSSSSNNNSDDDEPEIFDWIELAIDRIERAIKQLGITAKSTFKTLSSRLAANADEIATVTDELELQALAYDRYIEQANSVGLSEDLAQRVRDGAIDINEYDKETQELIDDYQKWYEKAIDCSDAIQQLHEDLAQLYQDRFDDTREDFENQLALLKHLTTTYDNGMDEIEERGYLATTRYYEEMRKVENENLGVMNKELDELIEKMSQAVNSGEIKEYSSEWYDMQKEVNGVKEAIQETETEVIRLGNSIREVLWDRFDYLQDRISEITDEAQFMIDLMSNSKLNLDNGVLTSTGMATLGLHAQSYDVYMNQADRYAEEIKKLNAEIANDPNNTKLLEQRQKWLEAQRESILNAEDEKQAMISMVEEGINLELSALNKLLDKYKESLDTAKSLYDYQKKVNEQAKNVSSIQKQLSAYRGDNSEEARSTIQKLTVDLSKAQETLQETQYQRQITETKSMLSDLYDSYEMILNARLDNVDALMADLIQMVNLNSGSTKESIEALKEANGGYVNVINGQISYVGGSNDGWLSTVNTSATTGFNNISSTLGSIYADTTTEYANIRNTITAEAMNVGYTLSDEMKSIWANDGDASSIVSTYTDLLASKINTTNSSLNNINTVINGIALNVASMVAASNAKAAATVAKTTASTAANKNATPVVTAKPATPTATPQKAAGRTDQEKYGVAIAIWNGLQGWGAGEDRKKKLEAKGFNYSEVQGIVNKIKGDILSNSWSGKYYGITAKDISKYAYNKFKTGGIVDYTGLAQVDGTPGKPEAFLNAEDTKNFIALKNTLRDIVDGKISFGGSSHNTIGLFDGIKASTPSKVRSNNYGDVTYQINIPIDHVENYDDFVNKMRSDGKFEKMIQSMTIGQVAGQSRLSKNKYKW